MKKKLLAVVLSVALAGSVVPGAFAISPEEEKAICAEEKLTKAEKHLSEAREKADASEQKLKEGAFGFFADQGSEGAGALEILRNCTYSSAIKKGAEGDATTIPNILASFD